MSTVHLTRDGALGILRLDNPKRLNAFTPGMLSDLEAHLSALDKDTSLRCVLLTAEGERAFCAGADINAWAALPPAEFARQWVRDGHRIFDRLARLSLPTIAVLNGHAFGGGLELASACDLRVMAPAATIAMPEAQVGIVPGWSGTQRLARLVPEPLLKEMVLFGRRIPADRAQAAGFAAEVADDPLAAAKEIAGSLVKSSPRAVETAKYMIHAAVGEDRSAMIDALGSGMIAASEDKQEGVAAFKEKREPAFPGK